MKNKLLLLISSLILETTLGISAAHANTFLLACPDLTTCAHSVSALTGDQYLFSSDIQCKPIKSTPELELTSENANLLFSETLAMCGFTRTPIGPKVYGIKREEDAKRSDLPRYYASITDDPKLPETADLVTLIYHANHPNSVQPMDDAIRNYVGPNARIYAHPDAGMILLTDHSNNIKSLLPVFHQLDVKKSAETLKLEKEREVARNQKPNHQ